MKRSGWRETTSLTGKVDREEVDHELGDLEGREILLPPDLVAGGGHEVVVVLFSDARQQVTTGPA